MKIRLVEPISIETVTSESGSELYHVRPLGEGSAKYTALMKQLEQKSCTDFLLLGEWLLNYLRNSKYPSLAKQTMEQPLYLMTDFTDPRPLRGLRVEEEGGSIDYPDLYFLGFYTNWDNLEESGVAEIFGHEYAHLWFYLLNFDSQLMPSQMFHTSTAKTDVFTAFFEGFAEHLQIVAQEQAGIKRDDNELWDYALDINAWLSYRDKQLRHYAVINNRFIYQTALPGIEEFSCYADLHMAHITSSAFTPEKVKNGSQIIASEGAVAAVFYRIYTSKVFKNRYCSPEFYQPFGVVRQDVNPFQNLYLKVFYALSKTNLQSPRLFTDFIRSYGDCFPEEKEDILKLFLELTHYTTVSTDAASTFGKFYQIGRRGNIDLFRQGYKDTLAFKEKLLKDVMNGLPLDGAIYPEIWVTGVEEIPPVPWEPELVPYRFDLNTATEIDLLALAGVDLSMAKKIVRFRESRGGFESLEDFTGTFPGVI